MLKKIKRIKQKNFINKLIPYCYVSVPFFYKKKQKKVYVICFSLVDGFFDLFILGLRIKVNTNSLFLFKNIEKIKYKFLIIMPFLLFFSCI